MTIASSKQRPPSPLATLFWVILFLSVYFLAPLLGEVSGGDGVRLPLLPAEATLMVRLIGLGGMLFLGAGGALLGERYLLIEKGERVTMLLCLLAFFTTAPSLSILTAGAVLVTWLLLFLQLGTYQDTHQRHTYLLLGILTGGLALTTPVYLTLLPILLWGGYHLRSLSLRSVVALLMGLLLPLWILFPILALQGEEVLQTAYSWSISTCSLPNLREGIHLSSLSLVTYLLYLGFYLLGVVLYRGRYYRESVRHRDMFATLLRYPLLLLVAYPLLGTEGQLLLPLLFFPLSILLARGFSGLSPRWMRVLRSLLLLGCFASYLYRLGIIDYAMKYFF
ncbi:MAG: hypothetical protein HXL25_02995 [Porphyromonadaceae bacterium]|nr:hypothetical protein [Porphyromonadaceae bacterium]